MLAFTMSSNTKPGELVGYRFTRPKGLVLCESMLVFHQSRGRASPWDLYLSVLPTRQNMTQGLFLPDHLAGHTFTKGNVNLCKSFVKFPSTKLGDIAGHRPSKCNVGLC